MFIYLRDIPSCSVVRLHSTLFVNSTYRWIMVAIISVLLYHKEKLKETYVAGKLRGKTSVRATVSREEIIPTHSRPSRSPSFVGFSTNTREYMQR
jgi:hypothetical protein